MEAASGSLGVLGDMYERREARWREEMQRVAEDREHVELLLRQALGPALAHRRDIDHLTPSAQIRYDGADVVVRIRCTAELDWDFDC